MLAQGRQVVASMEDAPHAMWLGLAGSYFLLAGGQSYVGDVWRRRVTRREQGVTSRERPSQRTRRRGGGDGSLRSPAGTAPRIPATMGGRR